MGAYEILALLGAGGMGEVYRARDTRLQREVAIKIIPDALANDPVARGRFETEARAVASLSHPNIIAIHDVGQDGTMAYAVMELLDGRTLRELLTDGPLPPRKAIDVAPRIVVYPTGAGESRIVETTPIENAQPIEWFPDSRRIVICGNEKSKPTRCFAKDVAGGTPAPLTPEGFTQPGPFSPDGSVMVVQSSDGTGHLLSLKDGGLRRFNGLTGSDGVFAWTPDGRGLLVGSGVDMRLDRLDLATGARTPELQFELSGQPGIKGGGGGISITPDGRGYAYYYISMPSRLFEVHGAVGHN
jgi:Tol biopolymer transport system component